MILHAKNITKVFEQGNSKIQVLNQLNLEISKKETVAILGKSGSGKSTLISLLCGIEFPEDGEIFYEKDNLKDLSDKERSRLRNSHIGVIFQQFHLIDHLTALENVMLPLEIQGKANPEEHAIKMLEKVSMLHRKEHFPSTLSGGEKQRVAIARSLISSPKILLADEPSGSLDIHTGKEVMDLIFNLSEKEDMGLILVTHDQEIAKRCQKRFELKDGILNAL